MLPFDMPILYQNEKFFCMDNQMLLQLLSFEQIIHLPQKELC